MEFTVQRLGLSIPVVTANGELQQMGSKKDRQLRVWFAPIEEYWTKWDLGWMVEKENDGEPNTDLGLATSVRTIALSWILQQMDLHFVSQDNSGNMWFSPKEI